MFGKDARYTSLLYYWHIHIFLVLCIFHRFGMVGHRQLQHGFKINAWLCIFLFKYNTYVYGSIHQSILLYNHTDLALHISHHAGKMAHKQLQWEITTYIYTCLYRQ